MSSISFAGCGFLMTYHAGVAMCLRQYAPGLRFEKVCATSGGLLIGVSLVCDIPLGVMTTEVLRISIAARAPALGPFSPSFSLNRSLEELLRAHLPEDAHERASGRLFVSVTRIYDKTNVIISQFRSREELIRVILCGCFVPTYSGFIPMKYRNWRYIDGSLTNNQPVIDSQTIRVSPFSGEADICPEAESQTIHWNVSNTVVDLSEENISRFVRVFLPQEPQMLTKLCQQGFDDTFRYLQNHKMAVQCRSFFLCSTFAVKSDPKDKDTDTESTASEGSAIKSLTMLSNIEPHLIRPVDSIEATMKTIIGDTVETTVFQMNLPPLKEPETYKSQLKKYLLHPISTMVASKVTEVTRCILRKVNSRVNLKMINGLLAEQQKQQKSRRKSSAARGDLLKLLLRTTNEQQPFQAMYYVDQEGKIRVTEIFDISECEDPTLQTHEERELNQMLEFDLDWGDDCDIGMGFGEGDEGDEDFDAIFANDLFSDDVSNQKPDEIIHDFCGNSVKITTKNCIDKDIPEHDQQNGEDAKDDLHFLSDTASSALTRSYSLEL